MSETIGWIGTGRMGSAMVRQLLAAGRQVSVWNRTAAKADALVAEGATRLDKITDAATCDVVFSMVSDDKALDALHADGGLLSGTARPKVWIDGSTVSPGTADRAAASAKSHGVAYVSAPISGNPVAVAHKNAIFAISGDDDGALDIAAGVVGDIGRAVYRVGRGSAANVAKLGVNAMLVISAQALSEVTVFAQQGGLSRAAFLEFLNDGAMGSTFTRSKFDAITKLDFTPTFTADLQRKDARLALELAKEHEMPMPILSAAEVAFSRLIGSGLGEGKDYIALILQVARDAGIELHPEA
jgi:3-hydroxyisobutyrate dehydrogenase-like beta-hydroxyacid dehydrogenase